VKPADLQPGHRIAHTVPGMTGSITVVDEPWTDRGLDGEQTVVDVEVADTSWWTTNDLAAGVGATDAWFVDLPQVYRLVYLPDTDIKVEQ
jgi:hypothetical protein